MLSLDDAVLPDLFDRAELEMPRSEQPTWALLAVIAAVILLLDVAVRRLALDGDWLRSLTSGASDRRPSTGGASLSAWRRSKSRRQRPRDEASAPVPVPPPAPAPAQPEDPGDPDEASMDMTSRLKAARDRARRREDGGGS